MSEFSPDGTRLAVATDIAIWVYNAHTGAEIALVKRQPLGISAVNIIAFAPDGTTLAFGGGGFGRANWDSRVVGYYDQRTSDCLGKGYGCS